MLEEYAGEDWHRGLGVPHPERCAVELMLPNKFLLTGLAALDGLTTGRLQSLLVDVNG
jgi:hypothetical protein